MKHIVIAAILLLPVFVFAQSNYKPGYVIVNQGDTLRGYIDYKEWNSTPESINFKPKTNQGERQRLTVKNISAFCIDSLDYFKRYSGNISMDYIDAAHVSYTRDTSYKTDSIFLRLLVKGNRLSVYSYTDDIKTRYFIQQTAHQPIELIYKVTVATQDNTWLKTLFTRSILLTKTAIRQTLDLKAHTYLLV